MELGVKMYKYLFMSNQDLIAFEMTRANVLKRIPTETLTEWERIADKDGVMTIQWMGYIVTVALIG